MKVERKIRSRIYTAQIDTGGGEFDIRSPFFRLKIYKHPSAVLEIRGCLGCESFMGGDEVSSISLQEGSRLVIEGDFDIGNGVKIACSPGATIRIGGQKLEKSCGISANTTIISEKNISIGCDFICSWDVFITDGDSHYIEGSLPQADTFIHDHVWVAQGATILKGVELGMNSIVASRSVVKQGVYPNNALLAGVPAKVKSESVLWHRDFPLELE